MANILYRGSTPSVANASSGGVSRPLTNEEIDKNFYALNTSKLESGDPTLSTVTTNGSSTSVSITLSGTNNRIRNITGVETNPLIIKTSDISNILANSPKIYLRTGNNSSTAGTIVIAPGTTTPASGSQTSIGGNVVIQGGYAKGIATNTRQGGDVFIDGGQYLRISGDTTSILDGRVYIGTKTGSASDVSEDLIETSGATRTIFIGHAAEGVIPESVTSISGVLNPLGRTEFDEYARFSSKPLYFGDQLIAGTAGALYKSSLDEFNIAWGVKNPSAASVTSTQSDVYSTRIVTGLWAGMNGHLFKFQRNTDDTNFVNATITFNNWVDVFTLTNEGDAEIQNNIAAGGNIYALGDVISYYTSDETLKTNIVKIDSALSKVNSLDGITFNWNEHAREKFQKDINVREAGVKAQQVQAILPEVVKTRADGTLAVNYEQMVPLLIEAIKELTSQVKDLQSQLNNK
jgi:hypothetical protein